MGKPKLLYISDAATIPFVGQSVVARYVLSRLKDYYEITMLGYSANDVKNPVPFDLPIIPCARTDFLDANKVIGYIKQASPDVILYSHDCFLAPCIEEVRLSLPQIKFIGWLTVDGEPAYHGWRKMVKPYDKIIVPSEFCKKTLLDRWLDLNISVVPYGVDKTHFHPPSQGKSKLKTQVHQESQGQFPVHNRFVGFFCGANQDRKNLALIHEAWREFERDKEHSVLMVMFTHSTMMNQEAGTYDLTVFLQDTKTLIINTQPQPVETIGVLMAASDILFHPSMGGGFELTLLEAMAAGTVPVTVNYAGQTDFCNDNNAYCVPYTLTVGGFHVHRAVAKVEDAVAQLNKAYENQEERLQKSMNGIQTASEYSWDKTAEMLKKEIDEVLSYETGSLYMKRII